MRFKTELSKVAVANKQESFARLASALTDARSALHLDRSALTTSSSSNGSEKTSVFNSVEDIQAYTTQVVTYLSLVKGFTSPLRTPPSFGDAASPVTADAATPTSALRQPLIGDQSHETSAATSTFSTHLSFCVWKDVLSNTQVHALNARVESAQVLLASGLFLMNDAREKVDALLAGRLSELDETQLKLAYQLFLTAAGVFDACLASIDVVPRAVGAPATDLSASSGEPEPAAAVGDTVPDDDMMEKWRAEQLKAVETSAANASGAVTDVAHGASPQGDLRMLDRIPDLAHGRFPQLLSWIALAEAQELVILRGMSRDFVDLALMAKLAMDLSHRYRESHAFAVQTLPCVTSPVADKLRLYTTFKASYYSAISCYFQGAASMAKDDAASCAQAIATFKKAKLLLEHVGLRRQRYDDKLKQMREDRARIDTFKAIYVRSPQIVNRDLDIMTHRNDSVYYEPVRPSANTVTVCL